MPLREKPTVSFIPIHRCAAAFDAQRTRSLTNGGKVSYLFNQSIIHLLITIISRLV